MSTEVEDKVAGPPGSRLRPEPRVESLVFERSGAGKVGYSLPPLDVPDVLAIPKALQRGEIAGETEMSEVEVARHFTRLSRLNFSIDQGLYPLGSCTMKHNPRTNEEMARLPGFAAVHPLARVLRRRMVRRVDSPLPRHRAGTAQLSYRQVAATPPRCSKARTCCWIVVVKSCDSTVTVR